MGEWGGGTRHVAENATHLKGCLRTFVLTLVGNCTRMSETQVGTEEMGLLSPCASHLSFALLPRSPFYVGYSEA